MGPDGSLPRSQKPATETYPQPYEFSRYPHTTFQSHPVFSGISINTLYAFFISPIRASFPAYHIFHDCITVIINGEENKLWDSLLNNFHYQPVTTFLLVQIFSSALFSLNIFNDVLHIPVPDTKRRQLYVSFLSTYVCYDQIYNIIVTVIYFPWFSFYMLTG